MKKIQMILALVISLIMLGVVFPINVVATEAGNTSAIMTATEFTAIQGEKFTTTLYLKENSDVMGIQLGLLYDTDILTLVSAEVTDNASSAIINTEIDGEISLNYARTSNLTKEFQIVELTFLVDENIGVGSYDFLTIDPDVICKGTTIEGSIITDTPLSVSIPKIVIHPTGDVSMDGSVEISDAILVRRALAHLMELTEYQKLKADAYYDGSVDISDAIYIQRFIAKYDMTLGNRYNISFYDKDGNVYVTKSVKAGASLLSIPTVPEVSGLKNGRWSASATEYIEPNFGTINSELDIYPIYEKGESEAINYYKKVLTEKYYTETTLSGNLSLESDLTYQNGYTAKVYWSSSNNAIINATTGAYTQPLYDSKVTLTATIYSYYDGAIESSDTISFTYDVLGVFKTPSKAEIAEYLETIITPEINYNIRLPQKISNQQVQSDDEYEVRVTWSMIDSDAAETDVVEIKRTTSSQTVSLVATVTFNGEPLEDDGKIYFDDIVLTAISEEEIRNYVINQIAANMGLTLSDTQELWNDDNIYGVNVNWRSNNNDIATIDNNVVNIKDMAVNGEALPMTAEVSYETDEGAHTFTLSYTVSVVSDNAVLKAGVNISEALYDALMAATGSTGTLTTHTLKSVEFVYLDLSGYTDITDLTGLSYCRNLRVLNISGLQITKGLNEISTLSYLEAFIARDCGIDTLTEGGIPVLSQAIHLKLLDLSNNNFKTLDGVLDSDVVYGSLVEVYLGSNQLIDISALNRVPAMELLVLDDNSLTSEQLSALKNFSYLKYLSLADNNITDLTNLSSLTYLQELRLQENQISNVRPLSSLKKLQALYLGSNNISNVFSTSGSETNVSVLKNLTDLRVLYLNDNNIEDISDLSTLTKLGALNVSNNKLQDLAVVADMADTIEEIYAENNEIETFSFVRKLTKLRILMLSGNASTYEANLNSYLAGLTNLDTLTLSGKKLHSLNFLSGMTKLHHLEVANCGLAAYTITDSYDALNESTGEYYLQINSYEDNIAYLLGLSGTLEILNISNNGFAYEPIDMVEYLKNYSGIDLSHISYFEYATGIPTSFSALYELSNLVVLYADNVKTNLDGKSFTTLMTGLQYISLENCGLTDASWLSKFRNLVYVDIANNNIPEVDLGVYISTRSKASLKYLYLDTLVEGSFADVYNSFDGNALEALSVENYGITHLDYLPNMSNVQFLNLSGTPLTTLDGSSEENGEYFSIKRYKNLEVVNVSGLQADITGLKKMDKLTTVFAIGEPKDQIFYKNNLNTLYELYNKGVSSYLYSETSAYVPDAKREGSAILGLLPELGQTVIVAAENTLSDNNPVLESKINDFDITWSLSNTTNYAIVDNKISVVNYTGIEDETLVVTAQIQVYPNQEPVTRDFQLNMEILRVDIPYLAFTMDGMADYMTREQGFVYSTTVQAAETEGFSKAVKPVYDDIVYTYSAVLSNGESVPIENILIEGEGNSYTIHEAAPLNASASITINVTHTLSNGTVVSDKKITRNVTVDDRTFMITYVANDGIVKNSEGQEITMEQYPEESVLFENITVSRTGYLFAGWFTDESLTVPFEANTMPQANITLYAKWTPHSFNVNFNANGGNVSEASRLVLCDQAFGTLPVPTRNYYTFKGWFTSAEGGGTQITADTTMATATDITIYAQWTQNPVSGWVLSSQMPSDAQVINQKWTYTLTTNMESTNTSVDGYTQIGSYWVQSGSGSVNYSTAFPSGFDTSHWIYTSFAKEPYGAYENTTNKRVVSNNWAGYVYWHWMYNCGNASGTSSRAIYNKKGTGPDTGFAYKYFGAFTSTNGNYKNDKYYCNSLSITNYIIPERTAYADCQGATRWFRFDYYVSAYTDYYKMFQYKKVEDKESTTEVAASDTVSNVQKWVQYRSK